MKACACSAAPQLGLAGWFRRFPRRSCGSQAFESFQEGRFALQCFQLGAQSLQDSSLCASRRCRIILRFRVRNFRVNRAQGLMCSIT